MKKEEDIEQIKFVHWMEMKWLQFSATAQATFAWNYVEGQKKKSFMQINRNKKLGVRKWIPDIMIFVSEDQSVYGEAVLLFVEMKKVSWWTVSPEQKKWIDSLNQVCNIEAMVCCWCDEAIEFVSEYVK